MKNLYISIVIIVLLILGYFYYNKQNTEPTPENQNSSVSSIEEETNEDGAWYQYPIEAKGYNLEPIASLGGSGIVTRSTNGVTFYTVEVNATLQDLAAKKYYHAWLTGGIDPNSYISIGPLEKTDLGYLASYNVTEVYEQLLAYSEVVISVEDVSGTPPTKPSVEILKASLTTSNE